MNVSNLEWRELFGSALLELDTGKLIGRIEEARSAISVRLRELPHDSDHRSERGSMYDALYALKFLRSESRGVVAQAITASPLLRPGLQGLSSALTQLQFQRRRKNDLVNQYDYGGSPVLAMRW
jgi:hypothetical protein